MPLDNADARFYECNGVMFNADLNEIQFNGNIAKLEQKQFEILLLLIRSANTLVKKEEIHDTVWSRTVVSDSALSRNIGAIRRALKELGVNHLSLLVKSKKGYILTVDDLKPADTEKYNSKLIGAPKYAIFTCLFIALAALGIGVNNFDPAEKIIDLPVLNDSLLLENISNSNIKLTSVNKSIAYIQYDDGVTYFSNARGYTTITRRGEGGLTNERFRLKGWVKDFIFLETFLVSHKIYKNQCFIEIIDLKNTQIRDLLSCKDNAGGSAIAQVSETKMLISDGEEGANQIYTLDIADKTMRLYHATPRHAVDIFNLSVSPKRDRIAFLAMTFNGHISLFLGDFKGGSDFKEIKLAFAPRALQWLNNDYIVYIDPKEQSMIARAYQGEMVKTFRVGDVDLTGYFSIAESDLLFSYIVGETTVYELVGVSSNEVREYRFNSDVRRLYLDEKSLHFIVSEGGVQNVRSKGFSSETKLTNYQTAVELRDYYAKGDAVIVATTTSVDFWEKGSLQMSYPFSVEKVVHGSELSSPYFLKNFNLLKLVDDDIYAHTPNVSSAYVHEQDVYLSYNDRDGISKLSKGKDVVNITSGCGGSYAQITYVDEKGLFCIMRDGTEALIYNDFAKELDKTVNIEGRAIDAHGLQTLRLKERSKTVRVALAKTN